MAKKNYDMNKDNRVSIDEIELSEAIALLERNEERFEAQKKMAWFALICMVIFTLIIFLPFFAIDKLAIIASMASIVYATLGGIVGVFMGVTGWMEVSTPKISLTSQRPVNPPPPGITTGSEVLDNAVN